ncbi:short-chain dehydrogenase [Pedobacter kyungheensis]|uniref:Short-chain dehydrogenase n=1 Tax=Pedobacter kyungheensis TaxID=1069985 RepID=A0A0C1DCS6_9SPHI|nr:pirin family protein [Pedobacter kyungheensis]KIA95451.1 short-chain dehydrogenase [Pedobacter kyungheensis]
MDTKQINNILKAPAPHMVGDGFRVHNFFPSGYEIDMNPFFLMDYGSKIEFSARREPRGVGVHPHRGFETVTIAYHGAVAHHDSSGNSGVIYPGDVQWMTAAGGVLHKEYHEAQYSLTGGPFQMVQLWVNLPAKHKMGKPGYQAIKQADMAHFDLPENGGKIEIIAGNYEGIQGSAHTFTPIEVYNARLNKGAKANFSFPANFNTGFMVIEGSIKVNGSDTAAADSFIHFKNEGTTIEVEALEDSVILMLSGEPLNEPIVQYGPFLMNTEAEIHQAIEDYNQGRFGYLEE